MYKVLSYHHVLFLTHSFPKLSSSTFYQMAHPASGCSSILHFLFIFSLLSVSHNLTIAQTGDGNQVCSHDLSSFLPPPYGNLTELNCQSVWNTFVLRHSQSKDNVVSIVLSALYTTGWVGIGFSKNGKMEGASAMVGWVTQTGHARIKQYKLMGYTSDEVKPEKGDLNLTDISPVVILNGANIFLAFQLKFTAPLMNQPTLFAFGSRYPVLNTHELAKHDDKTSMLINYYSSGEAAGEPTNVEPDNHEKMKRSHGALGVIGWGLVLPIGAMVARFLRRKDPVWYYLHTIVQFAGFLIVLAGVVVGQTLYNQHGHPSNVAAHRGIGYFALTLSITQVSAFFARPNKESKFRRIWNAYHLSFGVLALFFGALNIVLGIQIGGAGPEWKIGYGFLLGVILVAVIVLQVIKMLRSDSEIKTAQPPPPHTFQMN